MNHAILLRGGCVLIAGVLAIVCLADNPVRGATAQEVNKAIDKAKEYLYSCQKGDNWEPHKEPAQDYHYGGVTALMTHALLAAGEKPTDARLAPAIAFLQKAEITCTYSLAERIQVNHLLRRTPEVAAAIKKDADIMIASMGEGKFNGLYHYVSAGQPTKKTYDMSCSNYGALGIWAAAESDYEVPTAVWKRIDAAWRKEQHADGAWSYTPTIPPNVLLTAAGIATLYVTTDYLGRVAGPALDPKRSKLVTEDPDIRQGTDWLVEHWTDFETVKFSKAFFRYYGMYNVERVALSSGRRFFGPVDWYASGVEHLLKVQQPDGSIQGDYRSTAFAVIFLAYGRAPVVINKLEYQLAAPTAGLRPATTQPILYWHQRPHDASRFTKWLGRQVERKLSWQIVDLKHDPALLHDSPILYITGEQAIQFTTDEETVLRRFAEDGGIILANAENGNPAFSDSIKKLGTKLFPTYEFRELPPSHPIYTQGQFSFGVRRPTLKLLGLSNGAREMILLVSTGDIAKSWELNQTETKADAFQVAANIFHYATDRNNPRERGDPHIVLSDPAVATDRTIEVARLKYNSNWDPEPGGWRRLAAVLHNRNKVDLVCKTVNLGAGELKGMTVAHLTGTTKLTLTDAAREELKKFIEAGGTLIIDAAGGSIDFRDSIQAELAQLVPGMGQLPDPLPADHAVYTLAGNEIKEFAYRRLAMDRLKAKTPRLRGIEVKGRMAIFYSEEDLSTGLVGQQVGGIVGYAPETSTAIMCNILLSAGQNLAAKAGEKPLPAKPEKKE